MRLINDINSVKILPKGGVTAAKGIGGGMGGGGGVRKEGARGWGGAAFSIPPDKTLLQLKIVLFLFLHENIPCGTH